MPASRRVHSHDDHVVTPEAVVLELHAAGPGSRILARLIDLGLQACLVWGVAMLSVRFTPSASPGAVIAVATIVLLMIFLVIPIACETLWRGRTPGKLAMGIRIVTMDGSPISFRHAMVRGVFQLIEVYIPIGLIPLVFAKRSRRLGDLVAGTFALSERSFGASVVPTVFTPPWGLEAFVAGLDVSRMDDRQYVFLRSVLLRLPELSDIGRMHVCLQVAQQVQDAFGIERPHWLAPEPFLVCVAGAFQMRSGTIDRGWVLQQAALSRGPMGQPVGAGW